MTGGFESPEDAQRRLEAAGYLADPGLATVAFLAGRLERPLLLEGPAGVGKTALAKAVAEATGRRLLRLQCYEGLDEARALYEWDHGKQLLFSQLLRDNLARSLEGLPMAEAAQTLADDEGAFFHERFLLERPLLAAVRSQDPVVLLIDEVDRGDPELEALLLEVLSDFTVSIPELGTFEATSMPFVVLTSNANREVTDALRRRCLYAYVDYPSEAQERAILHAHLPSIGEDLAAEVAKVVARARELGLRKAPSVSEAIDWARTLLILGASSVDGATFEATLGTLAKLHQDQELLRAERGRILKR